MVKEGINWKFNPPSAPHHGGVWERLMRSYKQTFYAILGNTRLTDEILTTVFCLVEQSLNTRPLIPASADATDMDASTPNHFLLGTAGSSLPSHSNCDFDHRKQYARAQAYSDAIWSRWVKEYAPALNRRFKWSTQSDKQLKTGDLVWIVEAINPRGYYPLARVVKLHFGSDAIAQIAEVKTTSGNRPVVKLAPVILSPILLIYRNPQYLCFNPVNQYVSSKHMYYVFSFQTDQKNNQKHIYFCFDKTFFIFLGRISEDVAQQASMVEFK